MRALAATVLLLQLSAALARVGSRQKVLAAAAAGRTDAEADAKTDAEADAKTDAKTDAAAAAVPLWFGVEPPQLNDLGPARRSLWLCGCASCGRGLGIH